MTRFICLAFSHIFEILGSREWNLLRRSYDVPAWKKNRCAKRNSCINAPAFLLRPWPFLPGERNSKRRGGNGGKWNKSKWWSRPFPHSILCPGLIPSPPIYYLTLSTGSTGMPLKKRLHSTHSKTRFLPFLEDREDNGRTIVTNYDIFLWRQYDIIA